MDINIDSFKEQLLFEVDQFNKYWHENHEKTPEDFPLEMSLADWDEQFRVWQSIQSETD